MTMLFKVENDISAQKSVTAVQRYLLTVISTFGIVY